MRYRLRTLHILLAIGPVLLYVAWLYSGLVAASLWALVGAPIGLLLGVALAIPLRWLGRKWHPISLIGRYVRFWLTGQH